jgi:hypothetical protein
MALVPSFLALVESLACVLSAPTYDSLVTLLTGWIFARRRTITRMVVAADAVDTKHISAFHRLFAAAQWSLDAVGLVVFTVITTVLPIEEPVPLVLDDTGAHKRGHKVYGTGMHHDPCLSSKHTKVKTWGHSWVVLAVIVRIPGVPGRVFSLPVLFRLYLNHKSAARWRVRHRTRPELAVELLHLLCGRPVHRRFHAVVDSTYGGVSVLAYLPFNCDLTSRLPLNARLYESAPSRSPGRPGRPRKRGKLLPSPRQMLQQRARRVTQPLYGRRDPVRLVEAEAYWHKVPNRPLKIVAVEPLSGGRPCEAFYSTDLTQTGPQSRTRYANRWSVEETNEGSKQHLGFEEPQGWSRQAVRRTAPMAMLLDSLIVVWFAQVGHRLYKPSHWPWYPSKRRPSFADMLATLRRESVRTALSEQVSDPRLREKLLDVYFTAAGFAA